MPSPTDVSPTPATRSGPTYAELHCRSSFSFGVGASSPEELVERAHALGYSALAITDACSVSGMVRAHTEAKKHGLKLLPGAEFLVPLAQGLSFTVIVLPHDLAAWGDLCEFITQARRSAPKGQYQVRWDDASWEKLRGCEVLLVLPDTIDVIAACAIK